MTITRLLQLAVFIVFIGLVGRASAQQIARPDVPEKIKAPAGEEVVLQLRASGSQNYICQAGADSQYSWTLKAPEAELRDQSGAVAGRHYAGPTWKLNDGSEVVGKATAHVDSPEPESIPWLLVSATAHNGEGMLSRVTTIQRIHTHAGKAPPAADCSAAKLNAEEKSSYTADYYFYAPAK